MKIEKVCTEKVQEKGPHPELGDTQANRDKKQELSSKINGGRSDRELLS